MFSRAASKISSGLFVAVVAGSAMSLAVPSSAFADDATKIAFVGETAVTADFGSKWILTLSAEVNYAGVSVPLGPKDGTVDVYLAGVGGTFEKNLPIQPGGAIYISQPDDLPLLAVGTYEVRASYTPSGSSFKKPSQTSAAAALTISPISVQPNVVVTSTGETPIISATLGGAYVEKMGGAPPGTWHFDVSDAAGASAFAIDVAQQSGSVDPVVVEIATLLKKGSAYTVSSTFTPAGDLAGGLQVATIPAVPLLTAGSSFGDILGGSSGVPAWLLIVLALMAAALAIVTIVFAGRISALTPRVVIGGGVDDVELMTLDEVGLMSLDTMPITPGHPWLLSDHDPSVGAPTTVLPQPPSADAPTELLNSADLPTERTPTIELNGAPATIESIGAAEAAPTDSSSQ